MGNLAGVSAILSVLVRPSLVVPHVQAPDIRHLDWSALHASGVRFLVFDKDNCLTAPHSDHLEPALLESWAECQRVFGRENILIVSNSSGSTDDPSGLGAESLSRALGVPVLCHSQKKPGSVCVSEALEYFVRLSLDPVGTVREAQAMPAGSATLLEPLALSWLERRKQRKMLRSAVPQDADGRGSILLVGDRTMTDVVLAHRMNDELVKRRRKAGIDTDAERIAYGGDGTLDGTFQSVAGGNVEPMTTFNAAMSMAPGVTVANLAEGQGRSVPPPQCISVLTTGLWANEGKINTWMRGLETRITLYLLRKGFQPGQKGFWSPTKDTRGRVNWQSIAVLDRPKLTASSPGNDPAHVQGLDSGTTAASVKATQDPTLGAVLLTAVLRPLPPRLASLLRSFVESRPIAWITFNMKEGWNVIMKGLEFGVREAGILESNPRRRKSAQHGRIEEDPLAPPPSRRKQGRSSLMRVVAPPLQSGGGAVLGQVAWPQSRSRSQAKTSTQSFARSTSLLSPRLASTDEFSASRFLQRLARPASPSSTSPSHTDRTAAQTRPLHTSLPRWSGPRSRPPPPSSPAAAKAKVPLRNWIAAVAALVLIPTSYYGGMYLHDLQDLRKAEREAQQSADRVEGTVSVPAAEGGEAMAFHLRTTPGEKRYSHQGSEQETGQQEARLAKARKEEREERKKALELAAYHLHHERNEIVEKLDRVRVRLADS